MTCDAKHAIHTGDFIHLRAKVIKRHGHNYVVRLADALSGDLTAAEFTLPPNPLSLVKVEARPLEVGDMVAPNHSLHLVYELVAIRKDKMGLDLGIVFTPDGCTDSYGLRYLVRVDP